MAHGVGIPSQGIDNSPLVLIFVSRVVPTAMAVACFAAEHLLLKALAVELEAPGPLAVAAYFLLLLYPILLIVDMRNDYYIARTF